MKYLNLYKAREIYSKGKNVTEFLRNEFKEDVNTSEIIEMAYDLQAGTYIDQATHNERKAKLIAGEFAKMLDPHLNNKSTMLDIGTGELTTLSLMLNEITTELSEVYAFDISWSRLYKGRTYYDNICKYKRASIIPFVADMKNIPLHSKSIDVVTSSHALEPNGRNLMDLLKELFRITKTKCVLFEPSFELNSYEGKVRMENLGYIKDIERKVRRLGGKVVDVKLTKNTWNHLNPTACYIIEPPKVPISNNFYKTKFTVPGTDFSLKKDNQFYTSEDTGLLFPILKDIPILKHQYGILGTSFFNTP